MELEELRASEAFEVFGGAGTGFLRSIRCLYLVWCPVKIHICVPQRHCRLYSEDKTTYPTRGCTPAVGFQPWLMAEMY